MVQRGVNRGALAGAFLLLLLCAMPALAQTVVFDQGPTSGTPNPSNWSNYTATQNFADVATLAEATQVTAISIYNTDGPKAGTVHVKILADDGSGQPGALLYSEDATPDSWVADAAAGGYKITVLLATPFVAQPGVPYWYGVSGNVDMGNFGQFAVLSPGDGQMAQFDGASFGWFTTSGIGDQMFQLEGGPPAPVPTLGGWGMAVLALLLGSAGLLAARRRRTA